MKIGYKITFSASLYNRTYAKNIVDAKTFEVTLTTDVDESFDATILRSKINQFKSLANNALFVRVDDPTMIDILEPKSGNTVHNRLNELKRALQEKFAVELIGTTTPPETRNGYRVFVMGTKYTVTMEGIALFILNYVNIQDANSVAIDISDGNIFVNLDSNDQKRLMEEVSAS